MLPRPVPMVTMFSLNDTERIPFKQKKPQNVKTCQSYNIISPLDYIDDKLSLICCILHPETEAITSLLVDSACGSISLT